MNSSTKFEDLKESKNQHDNPHSKINFHINEHKPEEKKKGIYKNLISGGISAAIARTLVNPIERVEILRQVDNKDYKGLNFYKSIIKFYSTQGIQGIFKGNSASLLRIFPFSAIEFYSFEFYKNILIRGHPDRTNNILYIFLCGALTGVNAITLTFPLDVVRTRLACHTQNSDITESGFFKTLISLWQQSGIKGLYKGYSIVFFGSIPFVAIKQTTFDYLKNNFIIEEYKSQMNFIYGSLSGVIGTTILYPTYLIKRVFQANNDKDLTIYEYIKNTVKQQGIKGLYKGLSVTYLKVIPYQGLLFYTNEKLKEYLKY